MIEKTWEAIGNMGYGKKTLMDTIEKYHMEKHIGTYRVRSYENKSETTGKSKGR